MSTSVSTAIEELLTTTHQTRLQLAKSAVTLLLFGLVGVMLFPILILLLLPFKSSGEIFSDPLGIPSRIGFESYLTAWFDAGFQQFFVNSLVVVSTSLVLIVVVASLAAYALVQFDFPAKKYLVGFLIGGLLIPTQVLIVPLYSLMNQLDLLNSYYSLVFTYVAFAIPFSVFLVRQFFVGIPDSFAEAARMDGCSELQVFTRIYLPLAAPALAALLIYQFVFIWNEFLFVITFISDNAARTLPAGLLVFQGERGANAWPLLFAAVVISVTPTVIFLAIFQRQFIKGVTMGLGKG